jgi:hypothetical protein
MRPSRAWSHVEQGGLAPSLAGSLAGPRSRPSRTIALSQRGVATSLEPTQRSHGPSSPCRRTVSGGGAIGCTACSSGGITARRSQSIPHVLHRSRVFAPDVHPDCRMASVPTSLLITAVRTLHAAEPSDWFSALRAGCGPSAISRFFPPGVQPGGRSSQDVDHECDHERVVTDRILVRSRRSDRTLSGGTVEAEPASGLVTVVAGIHQRAQ